MTQFLLRRLLLMLPTAFGGILLIFFLFRVIPGDPVLMMMGGGDGGGINREAYDKLRAELRLDRPVYVQFGLWLGDALQGDLGTSYRTGHKTLDEISLRLPTTLTLMAMALSTTIIFSIPMGIVSALKQDTPIDYVLRVLSLSALSMPSFWLGLLIILLLITVWQWFPPITYTSPFADPWVSLQQLALPALVLGSRPIGVAMRVLRSSLLEELRSDYTRTAYAKGLNQRVVVWRHVVPNSFLPTLTFFGLEAAGLIGGSVIVESLFNVPGIGQLAIAALQNRDFPITQGILLLVLGFVMMINLFVDVMYGVIDPRIRYERS